MHHPITSALLRSSAGHYRRAAAKALSALTPIRTPKRTWTDIFLGPREMRVTALDDAVFPYIWLRDACQSPECVHPSTQQKLFRTSDVPLDITPDKVRGTPGGIEIDWNDGHQSFYSTSFLDRHSSPMNLARWHRDHDIREQWWNRASISKTRNLFTEYDQLSTPDGLRKAIGQLAQYGLLFVRGVPTKETTNEDCELRVLAERFGEIRPTFYGLLWDVMNVRNSKNIAYTNLDLGLHMDLLYFQHPPRYQILHCLRNQVVGGTSIFVDALHAAQVLRGTELSDFNVLTKAPVAFHYINDGHHLHYDHRTIELTSSGDIAHINYSPPFQAPLPLDTPIEFYPALRRFAKLLNDEENTYEYTLQEGDAVLFDNRRVLHARTAFSERPEKKGAKKAMDGESNRWLKGCYLEADAVLDRYRVLTNTLREKIKLGSVARKNE